MLDKAKSPELPPLQPVLPLHVDHDERFDWSATNPDIVAPLQPATAVYRNPYGQIVVIQEATYGEDQYILVSPEYAERLCKAIKRVLAEKGRS